MLLLHRPTRAVTKDTRDSLRGQEGEGESVCVEKGVSFALAPLRAQ